MSQLDEKAKNRLKQAKHYAANREKINAKRREKYREQVAKSFEEANKELDKPVIVEKPVFTKGDIKIKDLRKNKTLSYDEIIKYLD
jgi:putative lipase involved disintegration of autophagic bodies